jgi:hypothetical protein
VTAVAASGELEACECVDGHGIRHDAVDVKDEDLGLAALQQRAHAAIQPW